MTAGRGHGEASASLTVAPSTPAGPYEVQCARCGLGSFDQPLDAAKSWLEQHEEDGCPRPAE